MTVLEVTIPAAESGDRIGHLSISSVTFYHF
jgi:hypothetical protein